MSDNQLIAVVVGSFILAVVITFLVFKYVVKFSRPFTNRLSYAPSGSIDLSKLPKISSRPFLFGLEKRLINSEALYFGDDTLYAVSESGAIAAFPMMDILALERTSTRINNAVVWQVTVRQQDKPDAGFSFTHNYTVWDKSFYHFYKRLEALNPNAIKSSWSLWRM